MTIRKLLPPTRSRQPRSRTVEESRLQRLIKARDLRTTAFGLLLTAVAPAAAHASSDPSAAASDTLRVTLSAPEGGTVAEGSTGHFEVSVAGSTAAGTVTVRYSVSGTAVAGEDYTALSGEATVSQGENTARIALEALEDGILDKGETVVLALTGATGPGTVLVDQTAATVEIADNGSVTIALAAVSDTVGEGSTWNSSVIMSTPVADRISLRWRTQDGTALAGRDYTAADEVVTFRPGETSKPISVETLRDDNTETVEVFYVSLGLAVDAARAGIEGAFKVDPQPQSAFIECSVVFPPNVQTMFEFDAPVPADTVIGTVAANTTDGIPYYELDDGGENKFTINSLTAQISTTAALDPGLYELEVTVHDECGAQASIDVSVNVKQPNRPPVVKSPIKNQTLYVGDTKEIDLSTVFNDPDGDVLSYEAVSSKPGVATAVVSGTTLTLTAKGQGEATVTLTAKDPDVLEVADVFNVTVPNRTPKAVGTIQPDTIKVGEDGLVDVSSKFSDPDGDRLTYTVESSDPVVVTAVVSGSDVTYTGEAAGSATVTVTATDPGGLSAVQSFSVTVNQPNRKPTAVGTITDRTVDVGKSGSLGVASKFDDPDDDALKYSTKSSSEDLVEVSVSGSTVTYEGLAEGSAEVTVKATDPGGLFAEQVFTVTVLPPECAISVGDGDFTVPEDAIDVGTVSVTAEHCGELDYALTGAGADDVSVAAASGSDDAKITGSFDFEVKTSYALTLSVSERNGSASASGSVSISVTNVNEPPVVEDRIDDLTLYVGEGTTRQVIELSGVFSDPDGDVLSYEAVSSNTAVATATLQGNSLTVKATGKGETTVTVTAKDQGGLTAVDAFDVQVPNRKPTAVSRMSDRAVDIGESGSVGLTRYFSDPDGDSLTYMSGSSDTDKLTVNGSGSPVTFTGVDVGSATVTVTARDDGGLTAKQQFDVDVYEPARDCKIKVWDADLSVREDAGVGSALNRDVRVDASDCGTLSYALSGTGWGDFSVSAVGANDDDARIRVGRTLNHEGRDAYDLTLTVSEVGGSASSAGDVDISVTDVNEAPKPRNTIGRQTVRIGQPVTVDVTSYFTDEDEGDRLTFTSRSSATGRLTVNASGSPVRLTGVAAGSATVTVTAEDRGGLTATQTIPVTVVPATARCGITVSDGQLSVPEDRGAGAEVTGKVGVTATAACGTLSYALTGTGSGDFSVAAAGASDDDAKVKVARTLDHETRASYALKLTVSSGTVSAEGAVAISLTDVNEPPEIESAIPDTVVAAGKSVSVRVSSHFSDPDGDALTYAARSSATAVAMVSVSGSTVTVKGVSKGRADVTVTARDPGGKTASQSFRVTVTDPVPGNRAPVFASATFERSVLENSPGGTAVGDPVTATDPDGDTLSYALASGGDAGLFGIGASTGRITVAAGASLDHETTATHSVSVVASDGTLADTAAVTIKVTDVPPPGRPAKPVVTGGDGRVTATWQAPSNTGPAITGYDVRHRSTSASGWTEVSLGDVLTHTVTGLTAGTDYLVQVRAVSPEGAGAWSESGAGTTAAAANRAPAFASAAFERSVPEHSPAGTAVGAPVTASDLDGDTLSYALASGGDAALFAVGARTGQLTVAAGAVLDHESAATHSVSVVASDGALADTAQVTIRLTDVPPPGRPATPGLRGAAGKVTATWSAPPNAGPAITGYDLGYRRDSAGGGWTEVSLGDVRRHALTGLPAGTLYRVRLRAVSAEGAGAWSEPGRTGTSPLFDAASVTRSVEENSAAGTAVGAPVTAAADAGVALRYNFGGDGPPEFVIDGSSGQLRVAEDASLDYEGGKREYAATVVASYMVGGGVAAEELVDVARVTIRVTDVPAPGRPDAPTVTGGTEQVAVSWSAPENEGPEITGYDLRYREKGDDDWTDVSALGTVLSDTIPGLEAGTTYEVRVRASSSEGAGPWSESGEGTTEAANRAPSFDEETHEREVPENSPAGTAVGEPVTATDEDGDALTYSLVSGEDDPPFEIDGTTGRITVASGAALDYESGDTVYTVSVRASDGTLADTAAVTIRVTDVPAPGKPDAPTVTGGSEQVAVSWIAPANEGPAITGYDLRYRAKGDGEWTDVSPPDAVLSHTIGELDASTTYEVRVRASSSEGAGEWSDSGEGTTEAANRAPSFDAETYKRAVAENSAAGTAVGEPVTATDEDGDDLTYSLVSGEDGGPFEIDGTTGRITVAEGAALDYESGKTAYTVSVRTTDGTLADTAAVTIRVTDILAPGRPDAPTVTGGVEKVAVSWIAPASEGPEITGYQIRYRSKADSAWTVPTALDVVLSRTISDLDAGTTYEVQVRAVSSEGAGEWSESGEGTTEAANRTPSFDAESYEREVPENSAAGTAVGDPVTATDEDGDDLTYSLVSGEDGAPFEIDGATGRITVAADAALNYESGDTLFTVSVEASDGELAATVPVTIRVTNADDPGNVTLSPETARVGVEMTAALMDEDGVRSAGRKRRWQRSRNGNSWNDIGTGRMYTPVTGDAGRWLRVVFTYSDRHGPGKRAVSDAVRVMAANAAPAFGKDAYERSVPENSPGGTRVGKPVTATDEDGDDLTYSFVSGEDAAPFEINAGTGRITVAADAALNYESGDTLFTVRVEASDGELADTASVMIRVKDADDPGEVALSPEMARVGVELAATLTDEDGVRSAGRKRRWQRSANGSSWNEIATGGAYNPVAADEGRWLRAVFTYTDGHGPGKRAVSDAVKVLPANAAPSFGAAYEREVPENSPGGTKVGAPVAATDPDNASLSYSFAEGGDEALFGIDAATGQIAVAEGAALDYEGGDTLLAVRVEASDGELADTASVTIRVTNADDPGTIALSADVARVGERLTATLMDEDRSVERSKMRTWQRSPDGAAWTMIVQGAERRFYTPTEADRGKYLRAVFTYTDGHGPGKRAESAAVMVVGAATPVVSFGAESYAAAPGGSADVAVLLSPAASSALAIEVVAGDSTHTVTFRSGASAGTLSLGTAGLSAGDTLAVRFGDLPEGVAVGVPATTRIVVAAVAGDRVSRSVAEKEEPTGLHVQYAQAEYTAVAGGPATEITLRVSPTADRRVAVPRTAPPASSVESTLPDSVVFEPGDSLAAFMLEVPAGTGSGLLALGLGALPEAVSAGAVASATVDIADHDPGPLRDEAFDLGLAVFGRAVAEGARQAVGARIDAVMRPAGSGSGTGMPGSAAEWAGRAVGTLASLSGVPLGASSATDMIRRSESVGLPTGREAVRRLLPSLSFSTALGPQSQEGRPRIGLWAEGSAQSFRGEPGIGYDGGLRALTIGADARIGSSALLGVSLMRSDGDLDYSRHSTKGSMGHGMNSVHPYLFLQPSPGIGLWAMAGYGSGDVWDGNRHGDTGASLRMLSGGVKVPLARSGAFGLALGGDAFAVGMSAEDGQREGAASRARAMLEASWTGGGLKLATQAGARYDGGDADTGGGAETGASVGYAGHGLDLDLRGRLAFGSGSHREWGAALRLAFDPGSRGEGFRLVVSPRHGHDRNGIHGLMDARTLRTITPTAGRDWRLDAEAGYGFKSPGGEGAFDSYIRLSADGRNRSWSFGSRYGVSRTLRLGIEGSRTRLPGQDPNLGLRLGLDFTF